MKILIYIAFPVRAWQIPDAQVVALRARFPGIEFVHARDDAEAVRLIADVDAVFAARLTSGMVAAAARLAWVHSSAAAVEGLLPLRELAARGVVVTNSRGVQAIPIAEQVMGGLLVLSRKFDRTLAAQRDHEWIQDSLTGDWPWLLHGRRMTIVGLGTIGMAIATRASAFGMTVTGVRRRAVPAVPAGVSRVVGADGLDEALAGCEVLVLSAPGVTATQGMIGEREIGLLAPGAVLVNVARAQIVDGPAMLRALESGRLGGAVLDVFEREPLTADSPLWTAKNVVISPHSAGFRAGHWDAVIEVYVDELERWVGGRELVHRVDAAAGYLSCPTPRDSCRVARVTSEPEVVQGHV